MLFRSQFRLKKAGPKPSGPGLEVSFMEKRAVRSPSKVNGETRDVAWVEEREVEVTRGGSSKLKEEGRGSPKVHGRSGE